MRMPRPGTLAALAAVVPSSRGCAPGYSCYSPTEASSGGTWVYHTSGGSCDSTCDAAMHSAGEAYVCEGDMASFGGAAAISSTDKLSAIMGHFGFSCTAGNCWGGKLGNLLAVAQSGASRHCYRPGGDAVDCAASVGNANCFGERFFTVCPCVALATPPPTPAPTYPPGPHRRTECSPAHQCYQPPGAPAGATWVLYTGNVLGGNCRDSCAQGPPVPLACDNTFAAFGGLGNLDTIDKLNIVARGFNFTCAAGRCWGGKKGGPVSVEHTDAPSRQCYIPSVSPYDCGQDFGNGNCYNARFDSLCPCVVPDPPVIPCPRDPRRGPPPSVPSPPVAAPSPTAQMTAAQMGWYKQVHSSGEPHSAHEAWMAECAPHAPRAAGPLSVSPLCLQLTLEPPQGGVMGGRGGRILQPMLPENVCTGSPMHVHTTPVPCSPSGAVLVSWAEDVNATTGLAGGRVHLTLLEPAASGGAYAVKADLTLPHCAVNGGAVYNKHGRIATLCFRTCQSCNWTGGDSGCGVRDVLEPYIVEVESDLSAEVRRGSVIHPDCVVGCKHCYPRSSGVSVQLLEYDPVNDLYMGWISEKWGGHVGQLRWLVDAAPAGALAIARSFAGAGGPPRGHPAGVRIAYHPQLRDFGYIVDGDTQSNGMGFYRAYGNNWVNDSYGVTFAAGQTCGRQGECTWPGQIVACGEDFFIVWNGVHSDGSLDATGTDVGFMRVNMSTGESKVRRWLTGAGTDGGQPDRVRAARLAVLGTDGKCDRFLVGWGEMDSTKWYPERYIVAEVNADGDMTRRADVSDVTMWYDDETWASLPNGDVAWGTTWKRNDDGSPNHIGQNPTSKAQSGGKGGSCTYGPGTAYGYNGYLTWPPANGTDGGDTKGTSGFKTNEFFISRYTATV